MTGTDIRETLQSIGHALDVPGLDRAEFESRVRRARTRRTATRLGGAALVLAVVATGVAWAPWRGQDVPTVDTPQSPLDFSWDYRNVTLVVQGRLMVATATATDPVDLRGGDIEVKELLEAHGPFAEYVDQENLVHRAVLNDSVQVVNEDQAIGPVERAWAARQGGAIAYVDQSGATYVWPTGADAPTPLPLDTAPEVATVDVFGDGHVVFASAEGRTLAVTSPAGDVHTVETAAEITDIDIGGPTIAVQTDAGVEIHDLDGDLRYPATGSRMGALSPDGHWYVSGYSRADLDEGPGPTLRLVNATSGEVEPFLVQATGPVSDVWWQDEDRFLVIVGEHPRDLYSCTVSSRSCDSMSLHDETGTLQLPKD